MAINIAALLMNAGIVGISYAATTAMLPEKQKLKPLKKINDGGPYIPPHGRKRRLVVKQREYLKEAHGNQRVYQSMGDSVMTSMEVFEQWFDTRVVETQSADDLVPLTESIDKYMGYCAATGGKALEHEVFVKTLFEFVQRTNIVFLQDGTLAYAKIIDDEG